MAPFRLIPDDAERYQRLRRRMLTTEPWAFGATEDDDVALDLGYLRRALASEENAIVGVADGDALVGAAGVVRGKRPKFGHRAKIWGVFVEPAHRGRGHGEALIEAAVALARGWGVAWVDLAVSARSPEALRLYQRCGFVAWGREPETTEVDGQRSDEFYLARRL